MISDNENITTTHATDEAAGDDEKMGSYTVSTTSWILDT